MPGTRRDGPGHAGRDPHQTHNRCGYRQTASLWTWPIPWTEQPRAARLGDSARFSRLWSNGYAQVWARSRRRLPSRYRREDRRGPGNVQDSSIPIGGRQSARVQGLTRIWRHARSACRHKKGCADNSIGALCRHCFYLADHCSTAITTLLYVLLLCGAGAYCDVDDSGTKSSPREEERKPSDGALVSTKIERELDCGPAGARSLCGVFGVMF